MGVVVVENICGLQTVVKKSKNKAKAACLILHGFGADNNDLAPLADAIGSGLQMDWYFPNAAIQLPMGGRAWFHIDIMAMERAMQRGEFRDFKSSRPEGLDGAQKKLRPLYEKLREEYDTLIVGGFSQGAMMTTELTLSAPDKPEALVILSGTFIDEAGWRKSAPSCEGMVFFQSHGQQDAVLPFSGAEDLNEMLSESGLHGHWAGFKGGHEIPQSIIMQLKKFFQNIR